MIQTTPALPCGEPSPLLSHNFCEAPQHASLRPTRAILLTGQCTFPATASASQLVSPSPCDVPTTERTTTPPKTARPASRRYKRLLEAQSRETNCRLDNLHLRLENYIQAQRDSSTDLGATCRRKSGRSTTHCDGIKASFQPASTSETKKVRGRPKKVEVNRLKPYLQSFIFPRDALSALPMFDDIVTGTVVADAGGNTRPFSKTRMVAFLQSLDVISTEVIRAEMKCSVRHAQKVAMCLRIIERHAFDIAEEQWHVPTDNDWTGID